jgi:hypothetical protein
LAWLKLAKRRLAPSRSTRRKSLSLKSNRVKLCQRPFSAQ